MLGSEENNFIEENSDRRQTFWNGKLKWTGKVSVNIYKKFNIKAHQ